MLTKYLNIALILALVAGAGMLKHYAPSDAQRVAAAQTAPISSLDQLPN